MIIPLPMFTAPSYRDRTLNEVPRCLNLYPEQTETGWNLVSRKGFSLINSAGNASSCRGAYVASTGQVFSVNGDTVYEVDSSLNFTSRGTISTTIGRIFLTDNGTQLLIVVNETNGYTVGLTSGAPTLISDSNFPSSPVGAAFLDGYFIVAKGSTGQFYLSQLNDGTDWTPVAFATSESLADNLVNVKASNGSLYLIGERTIEVWQNTGNSDFPFERISGAALQFGTVAGSSVVSSNGAIFLVASNEAARGTVYMITQSGTKVISTPRIASGLGNISVLPSGIQAFSYTDEDHWFYHINTAVSNGVSYVYDVSQDAWHESNSSFSGTYGVFRGQVIINAFASSSTPPIMFDRTNGGAYYLTTNAESGTAINRIRTFGPIQAGANRLFHHRIRFVLEIDHDSSASYTLSADLEWSDDGGLSWSTARTLTKAITSGTTGQRVMLEANRLGSSRQRYYRLTLTGPAARIVLQSAELEADVGRN